MTLPYPPPYMTLDILAQHLCVCPDTVERWTADGILPAPSKPKGVRLWDWDKCRAAIADPKGNRVQSPPDPFVAGAQREASERKRHARTA